ncbi:MAG: TM2 domain-containing protein [Bacteroidales bacterium]|nr:TM2 domain-containing protein [Bacteroidales bacterium]
MKHFILVLTAVLTLPLVSMAEKSEYTLDNSAIENAFANAEEVSLDQINLFGGNTLDLFVTTQSNGQMAYRSSVNPWAAFALAFFLGEFGIHRMYLGSTKAMWACYTFSCCGIFGIVPFVDWIVLLVGAIQDDIRSYEGNPKFIMWL